MAEGTRSGLTFEEPPATPRRYDWAAIAADLRDHPGEWIKVFDSDRASLAEMIRNQDVTHLLAHDGFEVKTRNNTSERDEAGKKVNRRCALYLRWVNPTAKKRGKR